MNVCNSKVVSLNLLFGVAVLYSFLFLVSSADSSVRKISKGRLGVARSIAMRHAGNSVFKTDTVGAEKFRGM